MTRMEQLLKKADPSMLSKAQQYLDSGKVISIKHFSDEVEGMMQEKENLLMPYFLLDEETLVCQCAEGDGMCVHKIALLLAAQIMQTADHPDYHMAAKILTAKKMEQAINPK